MIELGQSRPRKEQRAVPNTCPKGYPGIAGGEKLGADTEIRRGHDISTHIR